MAFDLYYAVQATQRINRRSSPKRYTKSFHRKCAKSSNRAPAGVEPYSYFAITSKAFDTIYRTEQKHNVIQLWCQ